MRKTKTKKMTKTETGKKRKKNRERQRLGENNDEKKCEIKKDETKRKRER